MEQALQASDALINELFQYWDQRDLFDGFDLLRIPAGIGGFMVAERAINGMKEEESSKMTFEDHIVHRQLDLTIMCLWFDIQENVQTKSGPELGTA